MKRRMREHFRKDGHLSELEYKEVYTVEFTKFTNRIDMDIIELYLINKWSPKLNVTSKYDEKSAIKIEVDFDWVQALDHKSVCEMMEARLSKEKHYLFTNEINEEGLKSLSQFECENKLIDTVNIFKEKHKLVLTETDLKMIETLLSDAKRVLGVTFKSKESLAATLNRQRRTAIRVCNKLENMGLIEQVTVNRLHGGQSSNAIVFISN